MSIFICMLHISIYYNIIYYVFILRRNTTTVKFFLFPASFCVRLHINTIFEDLALLGIFDHWRQPCEITNTRARNMLSRDNFGKPVSKNLIRGGNITL